MTARWAYLLERRAREAGGDVRRRVARAMGIGDALAQRRAQRRVNHGQLHDRGEFVLGVNPRGKAIRLCFGGVSGRHGLMLGASGSGKSNALLRTVQRHIDAGFGVVVLDMKGDCSLAQAVRAKAAQYGQPFHFWSLEGATAGIHSSEATARS